MHDHIVHIQLRNGGFETTLEDEETCNAMLADLANCKALKGVWNDKGIVFHSNEFCYAWYQKRPHVVTPSPASKSPWWKFWA